MTTTVRLSIKGRVQGVGFRAFVTRAARQQALRGWVRNRNDGSVEALVTGDDAAVATVIAACARGPAAARVDHIEQLPAQDDGSPDFSERPTV
jgi:acylphosphatase